LPRVHATRSIFGVLVTFRRHETHPDLIVTAYHTERGELRGERAPLSLVDLRLDRVEDLVRTRELESSRADLAAQVESARSELRTTAESLANDMASRVLGGAN